MIAVIRTRGRLPDELVSLLATYAIDCHAVDERNLVADISYLQNTFKTTQLLVSHLQHLLNEQLSPFDYALGISSEALIAFHAAASVGPGQERWILPWQARLVMAQIPISALKVMDKRMPEFFAACYRRYCGELQDFGKDFLRQRFGHAGEALWSLLRGRLQQLPVQQVLANGVMRWQLSLPVRTYSRRALSAHAWKLYAAVNRNLMRLNRRAGQIELQYRSASISPGIVAGRPAAISLKPSLHRRKELSPYLDKMALEEQSVTHLQITATGLSHPAGQLDLF